MKTPLILCVFALSAGAALAHQPGNPAGDCYPPTSAAPAAAPAPAAPPTQIIVLPPGPVSTAPAMNDDAKFSNMDANGNGTLSKPEVAGSSELTTRFGNLDRNHDGKLTRHEYGLRNIDSSGGR